MVNQIFILGIFIIVAFLFALGVAITNVAYFNKRMNDLKNGTNTDQSATGLDSDQETTAFNFWAVSITSIVLILIGIILTIVIIYATSNPSLSSKLVYLSSAN